MIYYKIIQSKPQLLRPSVRELMIFRRNFTLIAWKLKTYFTIWEKDSVFKLCWMMRSSERDGSKYSLDLLTMNTLLCLDQAQATKI